MIRTLQRKIVALSMAALLTLLFLIGGTLYIVGVNASARLSEALLREIGERVADAGGAAGVPDSLREPLEGSLLRELDVSLCVLTLDESGRLRSATALLGMEDAVSDEALGGILADADGKTGYGAWGDYRYYRTVRPGETYLVVAGGGDSLHRALAVRMGRAFCLLLIPALAAVLLLCLVLSRLIVRPIRTAMERQRQFLADAGHELKTPLSAISVNAAVLAQEMGKSLYLDCIQEEAARMGALLRRMMEAARLETLQEERPRRQRVDLTALVSQAVLPFESLAYERDIRYVLDIQEGQTCPGDPDQLRQVAAILLDNAFKYVDEGGTIRVRLGQEGRHALLEVSNTGTGIGPADLPHVFQRFYRCDKARPGDGSYCLGLSIAKTIVGEHRGRLTAESTPGVWTTFRAELPRL